MSQDTLSDLLRTVHLRGALFFHVDCVVPWVTEAPAATMMAPVVMPDAEQLMEYHVVIAGECWAALIDEPPVRLTTGDVVVFPHGDAHVMSSAPGLRARPDMDFLHQWRPPQLPFMLRQGGEGDSATGTARGGASVLCGFLGCDRRPFNPLLATLPRMIHGPSDGGDDVMVHFARLAADESRCKRDGGEAMLERISELMFVHLLRRYLQRLPDEQRGWLAGMRDRHVGKVLALMHERPTEAWTTEHLAELAGLSRSAMHERFVYFIGMPPMQYLTHWRMQLASRLLRGHSPLVAVALAVGYESEAAFSRAFKRTVGLSPAHWRRARGTPASSPLAVAGA